ncbi:papain fold toxin domain-containing protein [[Phormidium ambiguum] IAM M-71]|uniref:papain fold toxin domain-containing protein n=1 Tax=[Phormidium ambiguum] IAM M-71 TaxID=454136 RepID=UPI0022A90BF0|nr:papain fold toxin domain-containing protein [Phormidium ambiguum]
MASGFGIFDCIPCARAIKEFLVERGVQGKHIKLDTGSQDPLYGRIYDDSVGELISTTGHHEAVVVEIEGEEIVVDNIHPEGILRSVWMQNLYSPILEVGRKFQITEQMF